LTPVRSLRSRLLKDLMTPEPFVAPHLDEAERVEARQGGREIEDDVLGTILIRFRSEPTENVPPGLEGRGQTVDGCYRVGQVLEDIHGG